MCLMEPEIVMYDKLGTRIKVGSYIVYGHLLGRCAGLKIGKVTKLWLDINSYREKERIGVVGVEDSFGKLELSNRGTLKFPDRLIVIQHMQVPVEYWQLLKDVI